MAIHRRNGLGSENGETALPAMHAVMKQATLPAVNALRPQSVKSDILSGARVSGGARRLDSPHVMTHQHHFLFYFSFCRTNQLLVHELCNLSRIEG